MYQELDSEQRERVDELFQRAMQAKTLAEMAALLKEALLVIDPKAIFPIEYERRARPREIQYAEQTRTERICL